MLLSFGGTKNGVAAGELVIFFDKESSRDFQYRVKQAGHLGSKMRFLAAPWLGLLDGDIWLRNARHANEAARQLAQRLQNEAGVENVFPVESNAVSSNWTIKSCGVCTRVAGAFINLWSRTFIV